jgi:hypothetical protein
VWELRLVGVIRSGKRCYKSIARWTPRQSAFRKFLQRKNTNFRRYLFRHYTRISAITVPLYFVQKRQVSGGVARFFLVQKTKMGKIYQITVKCTKWPQKRANGRKLMAIKYTNIFHCKTHPNFPKLGFLVWKYAIWQPWSADDCTTLSVKCQTMEKKQTHNFLVILFAFSSQLTCDVIQAKAS